jgi:hypothetical protein
MSSTKSPDLVPANFKTYDTFKGIDRSRDRAAMESGSKQYLYNLVNAYADWRGIIIKDPTVHKRRGTTGKIRTIKYYNREGVCWAQQDGNGVTLNSDRGHKVQEAYPKRTIVTAAAFRGRAYMFAAGQQTYHYDGTLWRKSKTKLKPGFGVACQQRLAVAGMPEMPTTVVMSRVGDADIMADEEPTGSTEVTKAFYIDISDMLNTNDVITGLGVFEVNRMAIFTSDQTIIYKGDPDYTKWSLDDRANIRVGCISHRTIQSVGSELFYCSRYGVHALSRSDNNGITIAERMLSERIEPLYKELVASVENPEDISAVWDADNSQYHVFFPQKGGHYSRRLTYTIRKTAEFASWSEGDVIQAFCGDTLAGVLCFGTNGGAYNMLGRSTKITTNDKDSEPIASKMTIESPILWHGSVIDYKETKSFVLQATGTGTIIVEAHDEQGRHLRTFEVKVDAEEEDGTYPDVPLSRQYEQPFFHRYRGVQFKITSETTGDLKLIGFAVELKKT